jgi:hypothetical protein
MKLTKYLRAPKARGRILKLNINPLCSLSEILPSSEHVKAAFSSTSLPLPCTYHHIIHLLLSTLHLCKLARIFISLPTSSSYTAAISIPPVSNVSFIAMSSAWRAWSDGVLDLVACPSGLFVLLSFSSSILCGWRVFCFVDSGSNVLPV